jgi:hypothetical protein
MRRFSGVALALALAGSAGCVGGTASSTREHFKEQAPASPTVLVMAPDVELYELTAGGGLEPKADWTEEAEKHVTVGLIEELRGKQLQLVPYQPHPKGSPEEHGDLQLVKLHGAMLKSILVHHYIVQSRLPAKRGKFDWSMGSGVQRLRGDKKADYVLFVFMRDSYSSGGRAALVAVTSIFSPITVTRASGGEQAGFASLVDLESGDVVWCNLLYRQAGDLRTAEKARRAVQYLLEDFPW